MHTPPSSSLTSAAEMVLCGGHIYTMVPERPDASAVAVRGGRIVFVGSDADVAAFIGPDTQVVALDGRAVVPGLVDGHCHLYGLGDASEQLQLRGLASVATVVEQVAQATQRRKPGEWILGRGWDQNLWPSKVLPEHAPLDQVAPQHHVLLRRVDGHAVWVNALVLRRAGITRATADPPGGHVVRSADGEPTGVLVDHAMNLVEALVPRDDNAARERKILAAADLAVAAGLTGVHEMGIDDQTIDVYQRLATQGRLKLRVYALLSGSGQIEMLRTRRPYHEPSDYFTLRSVKLYADGALGSRGAALLKPYSDDPGNRGLDLMSPAELMRAAEIAVATGWQLGIHAIGDRANRAVLDAYEHASAGRDPASLRLRVEHAQILDPSDVGRFARLGVIASMQPTHATSDMPWAETRLGGDRLKGAYAWQSLHKSGAHIVFGSDFPVEEVPPLLGLYAAVTRQDAAGRPHEGFMPAERLDLRTALALFTTEAAYASFSEARRGRILPGYDADLTIFDQELAADRSLLQTQVDYTIVGGRVVYQRRH